MKRLCSVTSAARFDIRPSVAYTCKFYHTRESEIGQRSNQNSFGMLGISSSTFSQYTRGTHFDSSFSNRLTGNLGIRGSFPFAGVNPLMNHRFFASASEGKGSIPQVPNGASAGDSGVNGDEWIHKFKEVWQSTVDAAKYSGEKVKEASDEVSPHVQQLFDAHPYLRDVIVPVSCTLAGILLAWSLLPRLFRRFHKYSVEGPGALISKASLWRPVPYEQSFWGALDNPVRYFITLMAFLEMLVHLCLCLFLMSSCL